MKKFQISFVGINSLYGSTSALLLKQSPFIKCLKLFDPRDVDPGLDVATINTQCKVKTFQGHEQLENAFRDADIIVISDESNEMANTDSHLMNVSANLTKYAKAISRASPDAIIVVASPPVNCLLPIMSQLLAKAGCYNHNKVVGSTSVDTMRASALLASQLNMDPKEVVLPVIGGSSEFTRVPVFSQSRPHFSLKKDLKNNLIMDIRRGDSLVLANKGSPEALNRAYSTVRFLNSIMAGLRGDPNVTDITLCRNDLVPGVDYFSLPVMFGRDGIIKRFGVPNTTATEDEMVEEAVKNIKKDVDKADYIVKGSIELPEHKYLSPNDRASSQKEMFDLFVKCLPKPLDQQTTKETADPPKKTADYSFKSLIKEDMTTDPFEAFDKKNNRHSLATKLKYMTSTDSFMKSAGCLTSPLQKQILILEPMECPSRPLETDEDMELEGLLENEDILHEKNLARFREKEAYGDSHSSNYISSPMNNQPFLSKDIAQPKTVDPIANFKAQVAKFHEYRKDENKPKILADQLHEGLEDFEVLENQANLEANGDKENTKKVQKSEKLNPQRASTPRKEEIREDLFTIPKGKEVHFSSPSGRCMKKKYGGSSNKIDSYVFDVKTNRIIPPYNLYKKGKSSQVDYLPEEENGQSYMPKTEIEESLYNRGRLEGAENDEKYNKLVTRLFRKLNGLNSGMFFPLKSTTSEKANVPKCNKSFTESAVRCRSPNTLSQKVRKKQKNSVGATESESNDVALHEIATSNKKSRHTEAHLMQEIRSQSKKTSRKAIQLKDNEDMKPHLDEHPEAQLGESEVQFVCPKCHIKVTCQREKNMKETKAQMPEHEASDIPQQNDKKHKRHVVMKSYKVRDSQSSTQNEVFTAKNQYETNMQEERLKKLKEKINKKLIPMMKHSTAESRMKGDTAVLRETAETSGKTCETHGTPLAEVKKPETIAKHAEAPKSSNNHWQGVPYIVKRNEKKLKADDGKNRSVFMKVVVPTSCKDTSNVEDEITKSQQKEVLDVAVEKVVNAETVQSGGNKVGETQKTMKSNGKIGKRAAKILNKLQLLELEGQRKTNPEEFSNEKQEKKEGEKFHKERLRKEISIELKADEVQNYMMTRQRGSRNVLDRESPKMKTEEKTVAVFEKIDFDHLKSEAMKDVSPDIPEIKPAPHEPIETQTASDVSKLEQTILNKDSKVEFKNATKSKGTSLDDKQVTAVESRSLKDGKAVKDVTRHETTTEKSKTKEASWTMTSPSKNFENIEEPNMSTSQEDSMTKSTETSKDQTKPKIQTSTDQTKPKIQTSADKKTTEKSDGALKLSSEPSVLTFHKTPNKLQLLAKVRNSKQADNNASKLKLQRKLKNVWDKVLSEKPAQTKFEFAEIPKSLKHVGAAFEKLDRKSAAVRMAKKSNHAAPKKPSLYRTKGVPNNVAILDGLTFPARRKRKPTNNLLKELASVSKRREPKVVKQKANLRGVVKRMPVKPVTRVRLIKPERYEGIKPGTSLEPESSEYAQDELQMAKLASEILKKKTLRSAVDLKNREWGQPRDSTRFENANIQKNQPPRNFISIERPRSSLLELQTKDRKAKSTDKSDVMNKLMSMPHVRHQVENFELPLGPLEVQPGLAQFNYAKVGVFSPLQSETTWESAVFNEYSRTNALPSLRDTRETFYLEEHPS